jgi:hypothetical protein
MIKDESKIWGMDAALLCHLLVAKSISIVAASKILKSRCGRSERVNADIETNSVAQSS